MALPSSLLLLALGLTQCQGQRDDAAETAASGEAARPAYRAAEDAVYAHVLPQLLRQEYWAHLQQLRSADGAQLVPPPPPAATQAEQWAYYQASPAAQAVLAQDPFVLNLAPTLRSLPSLLTESGGFLPDTAHQAYFRALRALRRRTPVFAALADRAYHPSSPPPAWRYKLYWRYEPFRQYAEPAGTAGEQRGLQLSRVCFNAARDSAFFAYDVDYQQYALGGVGLACKRQGRWALQAR